MAMRKKQREKIREVPSLDFRVSEERAVYRSSIGLKTGNTDDLIRILKRGLPVNSFQKLKDQIGISEKVLAETVNIALRTLARRKAEGRFQPDESERLMRLSLLFDRAVEVFGDQESARRWFQTSIKALGGKSPLEYADSEIGAREVEDLLGRIEHGVFS
jgi:putative toxin-antitoxin system antitoxin component (TIGR02293 family)